MVIVQKKIENLNVIQWATEIPTVWIKEFHNKMSNFRAHFRAMHFRTTSKIKS